MRHAPAAFNAGTYLLVVCMLAAALESFDITLKL